MTAARSNRSIPGATPRRNGKAKSSARASQAAWSGRFNEAVSERVKRYTASVDFDQRLAMHDIRGSLAHARMLRACGILSAADLKSIESGLATVAKEIEDGRFEWSLDAEDVHL